MGLRVRTLPSVFQTAAWKERGGSKGRGQTFDPGGKSLHCIFVHREGQDVRDSA